jgi:serine/threonine protein kinase
MPLIREPDTEPIPGYRLIEPLGRGGFGEIWKCEAPGGFYKAVKFVEGDAGLAPGHAPARAELTAIQHIKSIRHPFLLSMERVEIIDGDLVIVMELADQNLQDLFNEHRRAGRAGVPRDELLHYLREAADVLDLMNFRHGLQHLDIKPGNLFLVSGHVKVADFGLVRNLAERDGPAGVGPSSLSAISPRYSAPELFKGVISPFSDQYSLALVFHEMLTGSFPFRGRNPRQLALEHTGGKPDLDGLPDADRRVIGRALAKDPGQRFGRCREMVDALAGVPSPPPQVDAPGVRVRGAASDTKTILKTSGTVPVRPAAAPYLPDYQFADCVGRGPSGEAWEAIHPQGGRRLVKHLSGVTGHDARREQEALGRLQAIRHPALPALTFVPASPGCLIAITDLIDGNLRERFQECRRLGAKGLPRQQLIEWLLTAAEALDDLARQCGLQHQGLNPRNLLLDGDRLLIGDFGLVALLWGPAGQAAAQLQGRYAAPEVFAEGPTPRCDVYSLAVIYQEMLTGIHPLRGRQISSPNLKPLPHAERAAVAKALEVKPDARFASCTEFLQALEETRPSGRSAPKREEAKRARAALAKLLSDSSNFVPPSEPETWSMTGDGQATLQGRFAASLPPSAAHGRFEAFRVEWGAQLVRREPHSLAFLLEVPRRSWQRLFGQPSSILIEVRWNQPRPKNPGLPEVAVCIRSGGDGQPLDEAMFLETAPQILASLRTHLQAHSERREQERLLWAHPVEVCFLGEDGHAGEAFPCHAKDISSTGMGLYLSRVTAGGNLTVTLTTPNHPEPVTLLATCVRVQRCGDGWFEAGVLFQ